MSKRKLWILTIALSVTLLGLIFLQYRWIKNVQEIQGDEFRQLVNNTLTEVSRQVQHYYTTQRMNMILEEQLSADSLIEWNIQIESQGISGEEEGKIAILPPPKGQKEEKLVEVVGDTIIIIKSDGGKKADTVTISAYLEAEERKELERSLQQQQMRVAAIMKQMLLEDVSFEKRVEKKYLEKVLYKNLLNRGIDIDYEYMVMKGDNKEIYASDGFRMYEDHYYFRTALLDQEALHEGTYLYLYFPDEKDLVQGSPGFLGIAAVVLTMLMLVLFTFALYVIFRQKKLSDIKNDFVNNMTHELKTPISTISLASQMLSDESIPMEKKNLGNISRIIQTESKRLGYQVERVLQMAVLDQGHLVLKKVQLEMRDIVQTVLQNFQLQIESQSGKLTVIDDASSDVIEGDRVHMMNVVTNLLDNAVKYSPEKPEIEVAMTNDKENFILKVKDRGIGISKEDQKKVFDRFYRVSTGNLHDIKGFGLGLSYVKLIVEQHGGTVRLTSELNKGTQFEIILPLYHENLPT